MPEFHDVFAVSTVAASISCLKLSSMSACICRMTSFSVMPTRLGAH